MHGHGAAGPERVAFRRGLQTAVLTGSVPASKAICYQLRAGAGQKMTDAFGDTYPGRAFSLVIPDGPRRRAARAQDVTSWEGVLESAGDYNIVSVRRAARRSALHTRNLDHLNDRRQIVAEILTWSHRAEIFLGVYLTDYWPAKAPLRGNRQARGSCSSERRMTALSPAPCAAMS